MFIRNSKFQCDYLEALTSKSKELKKIFILFTCPGTTSASCQEGMNATEAEGWSHDHMPSQTGNI